MEKCKLLNVEVSNLDMLETINQIEYLINNKKSSYVVAVNTDVIVKIEKDLYLKKIVEHADIVSVDGQPLVWIANYFKIGIKEKVSGSDMVPLLCKRASEKGYSIFIVGGMENVAIAAKRKLESMYPSINIVGIYSPSFGFEKDKNEVEKLNTIISEFHPDILIACLGCPKQEKWIYENYEKYNAKISICAGATIDFIAGNIKRAPKWVSSIGFEWFYRFLQEPHRMFKRYFVDDTQIVKLIWKYRRK